jgi:hypothetical protein
MLSLPGEEYYTCTWNGDKVDLKLHPILHLHQDHHSTFERLVKSGILNVELIDFLQQEILEKGDTTTDAQSTREGEQLSRGITIKKKVNLSKGEHVRKQFEDKKNIAPKGMRVLLKLYNNIEDKPVSRMNSIILNEKEIETLVKVLKNLI